MRVEPARLFMANGLLLRACMRGYWTVFATWVAIDLQLSPVQLVVLGTAMELTVLTAEIPTGVVADVVSRRLSVIIAFALMGTGIIVAGATETFWVLVVGQMIWGLGWTFASGAETAWITDELGGHERVERLILRRAKWQFAFSIVGMAATAGLGAVTTLQTAILTVGVIMIGWSTVLALVMPEHGFTRQRGETWGQFADTLRAGARVTRSSPALRVLAAVMVLAAFGGEVMDRLDIRRLDDIGLPTDIDEVLIITAIACLEAVAGFLFVARIERQSARSGPTDLASAAAGLLLASAAGAALLGLVAVLPLAIFGLIVQGGLRSALPPVYIAWGNAHTPAATRATVHSFLGQADSGGEILGGLALAWVASAASVPTAMTCSVGLFVVAAGISRNRRSTAALC